MVALSPYFLAFADPLVRMQFFGVLCLFALGALDDRQSISPALRFFILFGVVLFVVQAMAEPAAIRFVFASLNASVTLDGIVPWTLVVVAFTFALVGFIVSVNMADGVNGLAPGMLLLWATLFLIVAPDALRLPALLLCVALAVIWLFNLYGRLFMGDSGIYSASALVAALILDHSTAHPAVLPLDTIAVWVAVPVLDCLRLIVTRMMAGRSPLHGDRGHLHHKLMQVFPARQACAIYLLGVGAPAFLSVGLPQYNLAWFAMTSIGFILMANAAKIAAVFARDSSAGLQEGERG